jgi:hypothetical protein
MAPDWTDQDVSDPGITLLELFDYLGDGLAYSTGIGGTHGSPRRRVVAAGVLLGAGLLWWRSRLRTAG